VVLVVLVVVVVLVCPADSLHKATVQRGRIVPLHMSRVVVVVVVLVVVVVGITVLVAMENLRISRV
jgi:hypothetical protein